MNKKKRKTQKNYNKQGIDRLSKGSSGKDENKLYANQKNRNSLDIQFLESEFFQKLIEEDSLNASYPKNKLGLKKKGFGVDHRWLASPSQKKKNRESQKEENGKDNKNSKNPLFWARILSSGQNIVLSTSKSNYFCIHIDLPALTSLILDFIRSKRLNCFAVKTPKGGCNLILLKDHYIKEISSNKENILFLGLEIELFVENDVVLIGPNYSIEILPSEPISSLPQNFRFIQQNEE